MSVYMRLNVALMTYSGLLSKIMLYTKQFPKNLLRNTDWTKDKLSIVAINNTNLFLGCTCNWLKVKSMTIKSVDISSSCKGDLSMS